MHVAINAWFWDQEHVGSGQYLRRLVKMLRRIDRDITYSLIMPPHNPTPDNVPDGINIVTTGNSTGSGKFAKVWFEQRTFPKIAHEIGADVAHVPYWGSPLSCKIPVVVSVLDIIPLVMPEYAMGFFTRLYTTLVSTAARSADHILTISFTSQVDIEEYLDIPRDRITVTYPAPDEKYHPKLGIDKDEAVREKYDLPEQFVLYLGGFDRRKKVADLMLAYTYVGEAEGDNIPLVIAGREPEWRAPLFPNLRDYAEQLNISDYVRWIGFIEEEDKPSLYRLASVFVYPSEYEGFGFPPLEAMASGTPTVTSDAVIFEEVLEDGAYLTESPRSMAGAIIALLIQKPFQDTMINQGLAQVTKYHWRNTAKDTLTVYKKLAGELKE